ncbi:MAG: alpha/beta hydrolase-fold protein, partial [Ruminococcus flavefaciens]|nr:alpha/beta hydrolase-fold protein [Ruminococcus flavefaciens]
VCDGKKIRGRGDKYMKWLVTKFKPLIDKNYSTLPDRANTAIGGSSMGGLMTLYAISKYNRYFSKGAALSPSVWACGGVPGFIKSGRFGRDTVLYTDYGSREFKNHDGMKTLFAQTTSALIEKGVFVTSRIVPHGTHSEESWEKCVPYFMDILFPEN